MRHLSYSRRNGRPPLPYYRTERDPFGVIRLLSAQAIVIGTTIIEPYQLVWLGRCLLSVLAFATSKPVRLKP
jgi:hypothetical protein